MQYDMHYYGTYAMAAAAGIPKEDAETIATAAQFVDDQNFTRWQFSQSGEGILGVATAHHPLESGHRTLCRDDERNDNRRVWVPFHFLPGAEGQTFEEKMLCRKDSRVVNKMLDHYLDPAIMNEHKHHGLHLMGIAAHVYADTFSHYGFSGISSDHNKIVNDSIQIDASHSKKTLEHINKQGKSLFARIQKLCNSITGSFTELVSLGHGAVLTNPDRPYLKWSFRYETDNRLSTRDNTATFLEACEKLHARFRQFANVYYDATPETLYPWEEIKDPVEKILAREGQGEERVRYWMDAMKKGPLKKIPVCRLYDDGAKWLGELEKLKQSKDASKFRGSHTHHFFTAADFHRNYILRRLLSSTGIDLMVA